jgi:hypothetical protein
MIMRIYYKQAGNHARLRVFLQSGDDLTYAGELIVTAEQLINLYRGNFKPEFYDAPVDDVPESQ